jgi:dipeptidyl aminopeptidase/acylaminoacyl peptidase
VENSPVSKKICSVLIAGVINTLSLGVFTLCQAARPAMVSDSIGMVQVGTPPTFSPDGKEFVIVTRRGNLQKNANDFSVLSFHTADAFRSPRPQVLLTLSSPSNNAAISNVRWLRDNKTIVFLGEKKPGQKQQIFSLNVETRQLIQLTRSPTDILAFDTTTNLRSIVFLARQPLTSVFDQTSRARGLAVSEQSLADLVVGTNSDNPATSPAQLFVMENQRTQQVTFGRREIPVARAGISLSPDGKWAIILTKIHPHDAPTSWNEYRMPFEGSSQTDFMAALLIDMHTRSVRILNDAPAYAFGGFAWSADGKTVVVSDTYLSLDTADASEQESRKSRRWVVEVDVNRNQPTKIVQVNGGADYEMLQWDLTTNTVFLRPLVDNVVERSAADQSTTEVIAYRKIKDGQWVRVDAARASAVSSREVDVREKQDMNTPARLFIVNQSTGAESLLFDLNPQFQNLRFGHVEEIIWKTSEGREARGGLYLPPDFLRGRKYPLVIQTHGWDPNEFSIDGWSSAGYAAQALAGEDIIVAQVPLAMELGTTLEGPQNMAMFEGLIDALDKRGLIDRNHVGLLGWSRTGYDVRYMLAFSKYPIRAAVVADAMDGGYWQYIADLAAGGLPGSVFEGQNGAVPFGAGLHDWLNHAPSFNLHKVRTPVRELGFGRNWFYYNWEWFVGLRRLGKPVELIWLPDALHAPVKPLERMTAQQGDVDWFCFWLKGEEDPDPSKTDQYKRWRELLKLQMENEKKASTPN